MFSAWYHHRTACTLQSAPQYGKSKLTELMMRTHVGFNGFTLCDSHGPLYDDILNYLAYVRPACPVYVFNPSEAKVVTPFNFIQFKGGDPVAHASRVSGSIIRGWGMEDSDEMPTYERVMKALIYVAAISGEPLQHVARLLDKWEKKLREWAISIVEDEGIKSDLMDLHMKSVLQNPILWEKDTLSVRNRLKRFTDSPIVRMFTGLPGGIDIPTVWDQAAILLCKFAPSEYLSPESAKVFGSIFQSEYLHAARLRMNDPKPYFLFCDEYQNYATSDAVPLIMETPKSGLRCTLIMHHAAEFHKKPYIYEALQMAQIKIVMGGVPYKLAYDLVPDLFPEELNRRKKKDDKIHYVTFHDFEHYESETDTNSWNDQETSSYGSTNTFNSGVSDSPFGPGESSSESFAYNSQEGESHGEGGGHSVQKSTRYRPRVERIVDGQEDYSLEEKRAQLAGRMLTLKHQQQLLKLPGGDAKLKKSPWVERVLLNADTILEYSKGHSTYLFDAAQRKLKDQEQTFLERSQPDVPRPKGKKKPGGLHPQE